MVASFWVRDSTGETENVKRFKKAGILVHAENDFVQFTPILPYT